MAEASDWTFGGRTALGGGVAMAAAATVAASVTAAGPIDAWIVGITPDAAGVPASAVPFAPVPVAFLAGLLVWGIGVAPLDDLTPVFDGTAAGFAAVVVALLLCVVVLIPGWLFVQILPAIEPESPLALRSALPLLATVPQFWLQLIALPAAGFVYERSRRHP